MRDHLDNGRVLAIHSKGRLIDLLYRVFLLREGLKSLIQNIYSSTSSARLKAPFHRFIFLQFHRFPVSSFVEWPQTVWISS